jgi:hypothetical protein
VSAIAFFHHRAATVAASALISFLPFFAVTFGQGIWKIASYHAPDFAPKPLMNPLPIARAAPRVVWIIFDEWDYRLTFVDLDAGLRLPEVERLAREAFAADQALPPGPETPISIPAYFTGRPVKQVSVPKVRRGIGLRAVVRMERRPLRVALAGGDHRIQRKLESLYPVGAAGREFPGSLVWGGEFRRGVSLPGAACPLISACARGIPQALGLTGSH